MKFDKSMLELYAVTDRKWAVEMTFSEQCEQAMKAGITMIQLREKHLDFEELVREGIRIRELAGRYQIPFIMNDQIQAALACDADGVHVGQSDMEAGNVRKLLGQDRILGVTAKTVEQARMAEAMGADYLGVGAVFGSSTKPEAICITVEQLREICESVSIPVVAIGGITRENLPQLKGSGAAGVAVVSAVFASAHIDREVRLMRQEVRNMLNGEKRRGI